MPNHKIFRRVSHTPEYRIWACMIQRCTNPARDNYPRYGGRGITIHPDWLHDFHAFYSYVGPRPTPQHTIDRIDNDGHYEPGNVKWSDKTEQRNNMPDNLTVEYGGVIRPLLEVCKELGVPYLRAYKRRKRGWPDADLFKPLHG